jgi:hypothetical protein
VDIMQSFKKSFNSSYNRPFCGKISNVRQYYNDFASVASFCSVGHKMRVATVCQKRSAAECIKVSANLPVPGTSIYVTSLCV